jgi:colanic acid biosynthesis glycosyl transferase WcaI
VKILYVSQYFPPEMGAPAARVSELSRHWVLAGHAVTVLTGFPNHPTGVVAPEYCKKIWRLVLRESREDVKVVRTWLLPFANRGAIRRIVNYASFCVSSAVIGSFMARSDIVIATSPQLLVGLSGWWISRWQRVPFIFEVRDLWPESLVAVGAGSENSFLHKLMAKIAGFLYKRSDRIVVVTSAFKTHLIERWGIAAEKIVVVENGVETEIFQANAGDDTPGDLQKAWHSENKFVVSYIGTMGMAHGLETLLDAAAALQASHPDVLFVLIGEGAEKEHVMAVARERRLSNLRFLDEQPRATIPAFIAASDACLVLLKKTDVFKTVIPTKMLEFMACARPVILGVDGQARELLECAQAGLFIEPENSHALRDAILRLAGDATLRKRLGNNGRNYVVQNASRASTAKKYLAVLQTMLRGNAIAPQ